MIYEVRHYNDVIMDSMASQLTSLAIVYSAVYSNADQRKHQSSASLAFVRGIHWGPVNSPHKWPVTQKMFPFDDVIIGALHSPMQTATTMAPDKPISERTVIRPSLPIKYYLYSYIGHTYDKHYTRENIRKRKYVIIPHFFNYNSKYWNENLII